MPVAPTQSASPSPSDSDRDGRTVRAERTREAIVDALLDLLDGGDVRPTAEQISKRAGVSTRSVFQHFPDREDLLSAAGERQFARIAPLVRELPNTGSLADRLDALVEQRARVLEAITPVRRAALLMEPFSPVVHTSLAAVRNGALREVARVFAIELERLPEVQRAELVAALGVAAAWPTWNALRNEQGLDGAAARAVMRRMLAALVEAG